MNSSSELNKDITKSKEILKNIKSNYILKKIFNNFSKKYSLYLIKYSKYIKNRLKISIKDYKEYSGTYTSIEIEVKPFNNKYGKFININMENQIYYHIYFNNNKDEINRNYLYQNDKVEKLKIIIDYQVKSFKELFKD